MSERKKNEATPKPERSKIGEIGRTRRGIKPERRVRDGKSRYPDIVSPETSARERSTLKPSPLETATRIGAEFIAQASLEKARLAAEVDRVKLDVVRELAREKDERRVAAIDAEARLAAVHRDLAPVHHDVAAARKSLSRERKIRVVAGFAAAVLICAAVFYRSMQEIPGLPVSTLAPRPPPPVQAVLMPESQEALESPEAGFAQGLDRLNFTLASAMGGKPADAIRTVHAKLSPAVCPFVWRDGQVSLTFNEDTDLSSLTNMFSRCADALAEIP